VLDGKKKKRTKKGGEEIIESDFEYEIVSESFKCVEVGMQRYPIEAAGFECLNFLILINYHFACTKIKLQPLFSQSNKSSQLVVL